jgi:hypothetical protein
MNKTNLRLKKNGNRLVFEVIQRPTTDAYGNPVHWGRGRVRYEDREQIKHLNDFFPGINRPVNPKHVQKLMASIQKHGFIGAIMVGIIKGHMICGDANHRWYALLGLKRDIPIEYREFDSIEEFMEFVITSNNSNINWQTNQYISTHTAMKNDAFAKVTELRKTYPFSNTITVALAGGLDINSAKIALKKGTLTLIDAKSKGYEERVEVAWGFANEFARGLKTGSGVNEKDLKANNQRIGEAIVHLYGHIQSHTIFKQVAHQVAVTAKAGYKSHTTTAQFTELFNKAYDSVMG